MPNSVSRRREEGRFPTLPALRLLGMLAILLAASLADGASAPSLAQAVTRGPSGLPLPRFVSLKASRVNLRVGPGRDYAVDWMYVKSGLPMEVIQEYDNWRRVRDAEGTEGWIYQSLLSGRRTAVIAPWQRSKSRLIPLYDEPSSAARTVARMEPGVLGTLHSCDGEWCDISVEDYRGWVSQALLWGAYPNENIAD